MKLFTFFVGNFYGHSIPNLFRSRFGSNLRNTVWLDTAKYQVVPAEILRLHFLSFHESILCSVFVV